MYKYETHMHTSHGSRCANSTPEEMVEKYKQEGYTGVFVTDHFFNGNSCIDGSLEWREKVDRYCECYEKAKAMGDKIGLDVFFAIEYGNGTADFLTYGVDKEWLYENECIMAMDIPEYCRYVRESGGMIIHAHPFRETWYIDRLRLFPRDVDGVEVINASHSDELMNQRAYIYANMYDLPVTAGSDAHNTTDKWFGGGVVTSEKITSAQDYIKLVKERKLYGLLHSGVVIEL